MGASATTHKRVTQGLLRVATLIARTLFRRFRNFPYTLHRRPEWRNWQTRYVQGVVGVFPSGFESLLRHHPPPASRLFLNSEIAFCCPPGTLVQQPGLVPSSRLRRHGLVRPPGAARAAAPRGAGGEPGPSAWAGERNAGLCVTLTGPAWPRRLATGAAAARGQRRCLARPARGLPSAGRVPRHGAGRRSRATDKTTPADRRGRRLAG